MTEKHTKRELFEALLVLTDAVGSEKWVIDGVQHELDLLDKRAGAPKAADAKKVAEQRADMDTILSVIGMTEGVRAGSVAEVTGFSVQKVTALLKKMVAAGEVVRTEDKKVATFSVE